MLVAFHCVDKACQQAIRTQNLQQHLCWVEQNMASIKIAGPLLQSESETMMGSLYIIEASSIDKANRLFKEDPYYKADIWQHITITVFKDYAGTWVGGKNWPGAF